MDKYTQKLEQLYQDIDLKHLERKYGYPKHEILRLKEAFELFDVDEKGFLTVDDLKQELEDIGMYSKHPNIDKFKNEKITFEVFLEIFGAKTECKSKKEVEKLYSLFLGGEDLTQNLNLSHFKNIARELELKLPSNSNELEEMIATVAQKGSEEITFDDFYNLMMKYGSDI